ncbi:uncharacterized protein LOC114797052 isoform X3 [Denticeps clupeoides]|uniref:uncharacterized protein LOC114797052 isoform X3 n=1 Tax=Denticeps clupeoides TaxID=299321 RepID=UPI0010A39304|nr:uncharacterized protein LOC114797052 isoform X3 [Denticeps clupeoides]
MAVSVTEPLCKPAIYHATFKVELQATKPVLAVRLSGEQVGLEVLCLCGQLDLLIRAQLREEQLRRDSSPVEDGLFRKRGAEIIDQMNQCLDNLPKPTPLLEDYLDMVGLSTIFPRVEVFIIQGSPVDMLEKPPVDDYYPHISKLNQLFVLCQHLAEDVKHLGSHKYIAHQLSAVYQVLCSFRGVLPLETIKKEIEHNFKEIKTSLAAGDGSKHEPQLPIHHVNWLLEVTQRVTSTVSSLPKELTEDLSPIMEFVTNLT